MNRTTTHLLACMAITLVTSIASPMHLNKAQAAKAVPQALALLRLRLLALAHKVGPQKKIVALVPPAPTKTLHEAAQDGDLKTVKALLTAKADINAQDNNGNTPLHLAVNGGHLEVVTKLIAGGAVTLKKNKNNKTAVRLAADSNNKDLLVLFLPKDGIEIECPLCYENSFDTKGITVLPCCDYILCTRCKDNLRTNECPNCKQTFP